jgi:DNA-3-methyladenine glycosylase II
VATGLHETAAEARHHLAAADPRLGDLIGRLGPLELPQMREPFVALARSITGQQLSVAAANTIWLRLNTLTSMTPERIAALPEEDMRAAGLSRSKARYLKDLAARVLDGSLDLERVCTLPDDEVVAEVTRVHGIGRWSAEMFLIFALGRPDVLAVDDVGLLRSAGWLFGLGRNATPGELAEAGEAWRPYRSLASLYLWHAIAEGLVRQG